MVTDSEVDQAVQEAKQLLKDNGYDCTTTADDLRRWFEADTAVDDIGLDRVIAIPLIVVHELVEIENVKRMGLALTKDVILSNPEKVDVAHMMATEVELLIASSTKDVEHIRRRLDCIKMWRDDPSVAPENREKSRRMYSEFTRILENLEAKR